MSSLIIGAIILAAILIPFIWYSIQKNKTGKKQINLFQEVGYKYSLNLENIQLWKNKIIGIDTVVNKILFRIYQENSFDERLIDLNEQKSVELVRINFNSANGEGFVGELALKFVSKNNHIEQLYFYLAEEDLNLENELSLIQNWYQITNDIIKKNKVAIP